MIRVALFIIINLAFSASNEKYKKCSNSFIWAPQELYRKKFVTFANHGNCPSWVTSRRYPIRPTGQNNLVLPSGLPFAFICGACYSPTESVTNLTAEGPNGIPAIANTPLRKKNNKGNVYEHDINSYTKCLSTYGITEQLTHSGHIICKLKIGTRIYDDKINFRITHSKIIKSFENDIELEATSKNAKIQLDCPTDELKLNEKRTMVRVWYRLPDEADTSNNVPIFIVPSFEPQINITPTSRKAVRITCAVYNFMNPSHVWVSSYSVRGMRERIIQTSQWSTSGEELSEEDISTNSGSNFRKYIYVGLGIVGGLMCVIVVVFCFSSGFCKRRHNLDKECLREQRISQVEVPLSLK